MRNVLQKYFPAIPIAYLFVAIFLGRSNVSFVYMAAALLLAVAVYTWRGAKLTSERWLANAMLVLSAIGLSAAVILSIEKVELLLQPDRVTSCSISPVVACSPVIASEQASAFGFSNTFIGIFAYAALFTAAMTIIAGATKLSKYWWRTLLGGIGFGAGFSMWLIYQGVFNIGKLCLYCLLVWLVSFALLWLVASQGVAKKYFSFGPHINKLLAYKYELITTTYTIIFLILFFRWSDYWLSLF